MASAVLLPWLRLTSGEFGVVVCLPDLFLGKITVCRSSIAANLESWVSGDDDAFGGGATILSEHDVEECPKQP